MAKGIRISELNEAVTPLTGDELMPVVQINSGGEYETKKTKFSDLSVYLSVEQERLINETLIRALGFVVVGTFENGAVLTSTDEILRWSYNNTYYHWNGIFPKVVPADSTPLNSGGIASDAWVLQTVPDYLPSSVIPIPDTTNAGDILRVSDTGYYELSDVLDDKLDIDVFNKSPVFHTKLAATAIPASVATVVPLITPSIDTHSSFSANSFKPQIPGYYLISAQYSGVTIAQTYGHWIEIAKNGVAIMTGTYSLGSSNGSSVTVIADLNGTTDSISPRVYAGTATSITATAGFFSATFIKGL